MCATCFRGQRRGFFRCFLRSKRICSNLSTLSAFCSILIVSSRVRIAPSPTGDPHVGTAYVALLNQLFARSQNGKFILRIEDTDKERSRKDFEQSIFQALHWCGIEWDEGPDIGGPFGPYRQSERLNRYREIADKLLEGGKAYKCFATQEELSEMRELASAGKFKGYDRRYRNLSPEEIKEREASGQSYVIRLRIPLDGECHFRDEVKGSVVVPWRDIDDQVVLKSDGYPTYHLANIVDDHDMQISHVIRGDEWLSSTPKHIFLYNALHWKPPLFLHVPLLLGQDGRKLSKRRNPTSIFYYRDAGYLPESLINFLTLMGYTMPDGREIYSLDEIIESFDPKRIGISGAFFDIQKLNWLNQQRIIRDLTPDQLWNRLKSWMFGDKTMLKLMPLCHTRIKTLSEVMELADFLFIDHLPYSKELLCPKGFDEIQTKQMLQTAVWQFDEQEDWRSSGVDRGSRELALKWDIPLKKGIIPALYSSLMGKRHGLPLFETMDLLGKERMRARLMRAIEFLGSLSTKQLRELQKAWNQDCLPKLWKQKVL